MEVRSKINSKYSEKQMFSLIASILLLLIIATMLLTTYFLTPKLILDQNEIEINVNEEYSKVDYKAYQLSKDLKDKVVISGSVDTSKIGDYEILYELRHDFFDIKKILLVKVVDKESPTLTLKGEESVNVCENKEYKEEGYLAFDNYDGDISALVEKEILDDKIIYSIKDSSGNTSTVERTLNKEDKKGPTIKLNGKETIKLNVGSQYSEAGATASDNCDGDVSASIKIEGSVDTSKVGEYTIKYSATDTKGNKSEKKRKVVVEEASEIVETDPNNSTGEIYLTFDDGPSSYTNSILDTLKKYNIKATFFVTKNGSDATILREYEEGHTIALHTYTHDWDIYKTVDTYLDDLEKISNRVKNITGVESKYVRFPGGSTNQKVYHRSDHKLTIKDFINALYERGYKYFDWNVCVEDAGACASKSDKKTCVYNYFKNGLKPNRQNIVLLHDVKSYTAESLENMIKYGLAKGYTFKAIDDNTDTAHMKNFD